MEDAGVTETEDAGVASVQSSNGARVEDDGAPIVRVFAAYRKNSKNLKYSHLPSLSEGIFGNFSASK